MSALEKAIGEVKTLRRTVTFTGTLMGVMGLLVIGYPLAPATIRTTLLGWIMVAVGIMRYIFARHFQTTGSAVPAKAVRYARPQTR